MEKTIEAIYEGGVLRPIEPLDWLDDHKRVTVTVRAPDGARPLEGWSGGLTDADAQAMRQAIEAECEQVNPDEWK
jgi:predicted DNA-binding antitoxin AbrB/MazE fold protein